MVWLMCVVVTYDVDSWMKRGASRPAVAGNMSHVAGMRDLFEEIHSFLIRGTRGGEGDGEKFNVAVG